MCGVGLFSFGRPQENISDLITMPVINAKVGKETTFTDGVIGSGSDILFSHTANFESRDVGKKISVQNAEPGLHPLVTTIREVVDNHHVKLANEAHLGSLPITRPIPLSHDFTYYVDGAWGDAVVLTDGSITAGSNTLTVPSGKFTVDDLGKVIVVYGAGAYVPDPKNIAQFLQPLTTAISKVIDQQNIQLADAAGTAISRSPRVVYGHDDTQALQNALDELAASDGSGGNVGGVLEIPPGHYLTRGLVMDIPIPGSGGLAKSYNNICLKGSGRDDCVLENWDVQVDVVEYRGVIAIGFNMSMSTVPLRAFSNITISDLTVRQVLNAFKQGQKDTVKAIRGEMADVVHVRGCRIISGSHEGLYSGGGNNTHFWHVSACEFFGCGLSGPGNINNTSALNLNGEYCVAENNVISGSGQGIEIGTRRSRLVNNKIYARTTYDSTTKDSLNQPGINVGNTGAGIWENEIVGNYLVGWRTPIQVTNSNGTVNRTTIRNNEMVNCGGLSIESGLEHNNFNRFDMTDEVIHGVSTVEGNKFLYTNAFYNVDDNKSGSAINWQQAVISLQSELNGQLGLESVLIENNEVSILVVPRVSLSRIGSI